MNQSAAARAVHGEFDPSSALRIAASFLLSEDEGRPFLFLAEKKWPTLSRGADTFSEREDATISDMTSAAKKLWKRLAIAGGVLLVIAGAAVKKVLTLAADPVGEKDCPPLFPSSGAPVVADPSVEAYGSLPWEQKGGTINDASCLDRTTVYGIVRVKTEEDIRNALAFAREKKLKLSIAGVRHSMGGQAFSRGAIVLDMTGFNKAMLHEDAKTMTVQSGATWHDLQLLLHPRFAIKAMQSTDIFTVGGSIAVNAHGMDHRSGSVGSSVRSMRVLLPDGTVKTASRTENADLFRLVVGGYGLFGIVLDAELDVVQNDVYETGRKVIATEEFPAVFEKDILPDDKLGLFYGHLSTSPGSFLKEMILYTYRKAEDEGARIAPLGEVASVKLRRFTVNFSKLGSVAMRLKWFLEKHVEPRLESCTVSRNAAQGSGEACLVSRNDPMHDSVKYLKNSLPNDTDILHEYFIPRSEFTRFVDGMREILERNRANLLNASIRVVHAEDIALSYAPKDAFAVVLYINQATDKRGNDRMAAVTKELIDLTTSVGGRFFLPYQLHYTADQLKASYPEIASVFAEKIARDPDGILSNTWYERYAQIVTPARQPGS